jgi:predicted nucleic acid-binding protein
MHLCDTNILSELARPSPNAGVVAWAQTVQTIHLSVITVEEIYFGLTWKPNSRIRAWFDTFLETHCTIWPVTVDISRRCGTIRGDLQAKGQTRSQADMLIAATAQLHAFTLVTRNTRDFDDCAIALLNPFR